jgi:putative iron-only hydrogenase system regulator
MGILVHAREGAGMETRVAVVGIVVEDSESVEKLNAILHEYGSYIIGRMGVPYRTRGISVISIALDAPNDVISSMAGQIGNLPGVSAKTAYSSVSFVD